EALRERTLEEERPQFLSVIAPAGTGKTRLLEEFVTGLNPPDGFRLATARCPSYGEAMVYLPLQGLLQELLGTEINREQVMARFMHGGYRAADAARLADHVLATLGIGSQGGSTDREVIFNAWRLLIETLACQSPHIIAFENLHWASESLLDLVEHLTSTRVQAALLVVVLSRPELLDRRPNWGGGRQDFTSLALRPLSTKRSGELVKRLSPDLSEEVLAQIAERSGGNPFFILEMVRGLAERGLTNAGTTTEALPDTVHTAVLARLDMLSKVEREILQVAAVASRTFTLALLLRVLSSYRQEELVSALDNLLARDLLAPAVGGAYTFRQGLVLDVTHRMLSRAERIRLHKAIATALLEEAGEHTDECVELLAYHYYEVVQISKLSAVPQRLVVETERAITFQVRAGELASRVGATGEALTHFQNAIELAGEVEKVELYEKLGDNLTRDMHMKIREAYHEALALWRKLPAGQALPGARLIRKLLMTYLRLPGNPLKQEEATILWQEGLDLAKLAGDEHEDWLIRIASLFMIGDLLELSVEEMHQNAKVLNLKQLAVDAASYAEQCEDWEMLSTILDGHATLQLRCGENIEAMETTQRRLQLTGLSFNERVDVITSVIAVSMLCGEYDTCIQVMREKLDTWRPEEPLEVFANTLNGPLWASFLSGRWSEASRFRQALDEIWMRTQSREGAGILLLGSYLALLLLALSREDQREIERLDGLVRQIMPGFRGTETLPFVAAYRDGDFSHLEVGNRGSDIAGLYMTLYSENEQCPPAKVMQLGTYYADDLTLRASAIVRALKADDNEALALAIDDAEKHQLIVHAAHMRIVLAKRSGDLSQLERARSVLEHLEDRLFLRKLRSIEAVLQGK
ncbi:MAG TPA: AAA family ATPase, partial [Ktedonobacteraceae bacterium]|nr:AAA family ATPase [Ktedonobacteraceae bacterium]